LARHASIGVRRGRGTGGSGKDTPPRTALGSKRAATDGSRRRAGGSRGWRRSHDSPLEGGGFELPVPRTMQARLKAKIAGFGCMPPSIICSCRR